MFGSMEFCSKFISIGYCVFVVVKFSDVYAQKDYCSINNKCCPENTTHISCTNNGIWGFDESCESAKLIRMTPARMRLLEDLHNYRRQLLASGCMRGFEPASRMGVMKWCREHSDLACYNIFRCVYGHDDCRSTETYRNAGQNLFLHYCKFPNNDMESLMKDACQGWWDEHHNCDMDVMNSFQPDPDRPTGHFTQMARDKSNRFGCCMGYWISEGLHQYSLVCNYGMTSSRNRRVYMTGMPGSDCKTGCDAKYPALCNAPERYPTELEEMELEYDLAHGIPTSQTASSSLYSSNRSKRSRSSKLSKSTRATTSVHTFATAGSRAKPQRLPL